MIFENKIYDTSKSNDYTSVIDNVQTQFEDITASIEKSSVYHLMTQN